MLKATYSQSIHKLRDDYHHLYWTRPFFPSKIAAAISALPPMVGDKPSAYEPEDAIRIIKAFKESHWLSKLLFKCLRIFKASSLLADYDNNKDNTSFLIAHTEIPVDTNAIEPSDLPLQEIPKGGYVNFYWAGNEPTKKQLKALQAWSNHCKNTDFKVNLCVPNDIIELLLQKKKLTPGISGQYTLIPEGILITNMDRLLSKYTSRYPSVIDYYNQLIRNKNYAFASDVAKLVIQNEYPGFCVDMDIRPADPMLSSLESLYTAFVDAEFYPDKTDFYTSLIIVKNSFILEFAIFITFQQGKIFHLLGHLEDYYRTHQTELKRDLRDFASYKQLPRVKELNKSFFMDKKDFKYLRAFLEKDSDTFSCLNIDEKEEGHPMYGIYATDRFQTLIKAYEHTTIGYFSKQVPLKYKSLYQQVIGRYFAFDQSNLELYNWANPGYLRLTQLKEAVAKIEAQRLTFFEKTGRVRQGKSLVKVEDLANIFEQLLQCSPQGSPQCEIQKQFDIFNEKYATQYYLSVTKLEEELEHLKKLTCDFEDECPRLAAVFIELTNAKPLLRDMLQPSLNAKASL